MGAGNIGAGEREEVTIRVAPIQTTKRSSRSTPSFSRVPYGFRPYCDLPTSGLSEPLGSHPYYSMAEVYG